ncbi:MAG: hypothetical protein H6Q66_1871 [Firmicutes bacterium]|nr:hypothetical protein [Bacillota bacterium]
MSAASAVAIYGSENVFKEKTKYLQFREKYNNIKSLVESDFLNLKNFSNLLCIQKMGMQSKLLKYK